MLSDNVLYRIKIKGVLSEAWASQFGQLSLTHMAGCTTLEGRVDQAALFGVLSRIQNLGMPLLLVEQIKTKHEEEIYDSSPNRT